MQQRSTKGDNRCCGIDRNLSEEWEIFATMYECRQMRWRGVGQEDDGESGNMTKCVLQSVNEQLVQARMEKFGYRRQLVLNWIYVYSIQYKPGS